MAKLGHLCMDRLGTWFMVSFGLKLHGVCVYKLLSAVVDRPECEIGHFRHRFQLR